MGRFYFHSLPDHLSGLAGYENTNRSKPGGKTVYTDPKQAAEILGTRREDSTLRQEVEAWLGEIPAPLANCQPRMVLARSLASANRESERFAEIAAAVGLKPTWLEYHADRLVSKNPEKRALGKLVFDHGVGRNGGRKTQQAGVVDFGRWDGRPVNTIQTTWGEPLVATHHRLVRTKFGAETELWDGSEWLSLQGGNARAYYPRYLALFVAHGVLAECFPTQGREGEFTQSVVMPAIEALKNRFGVEPLIVAHIPDERAEEPAWTEYDGALQPHLQPPRP